VSTRNKKVSEKENISHRVRMLRERLGLNQEEFAKSLGFSRNYLSMVEGGRPPGKGFLLAIQQSEQRTGVVREDETPHHAHKESAGGARAALKFFRERAGLTIPQLAKLTRRPAPILDQLENGTIKISEDHVDAIARELKLSAEEREALLDGSEHPLILSAGIEGTYGARSKLNVPPGMKGRPVPLLSMAQAGSFDAGHTDELYAYETYWAADIPDGRAFAIRVVGNSMEPDICEGDVVICSGSAEADSGVCAAVRTKSDQAFIKFWKQQGDVAVLESANPAYPPIKFPMAEIAGVWPVIERIKRGMIRKQ
jgi:repressor LexA